jgi:hypothetical protein
MTSDFVLDPQFADIMSFPRHSLEPLPIQVQRLATGCIGRTVWPKSELQSMAPNLHPVLHLGEELQNFVACGRSRPHPIPSFERTTQSPFSCVITFSADLLRLLSQNRSGSQSSLTVPRIRVQPETDVPVNVESLEPMGLTRRGAASSDFKCQRSECKHPAMPF